MEKLFNRNDTCIKKKRIEKGLTTGEYEGVNIGNMQNPKMINIGKCFWPKEKEATKKLFIEYKDNFSWIYEDLKSYKSGKMKYQIPLKLDAISF